MDVAQIVGFTAAGLSCIAALPHLMKSWKDGTQGVSSTAWSLAAANSTLWVTFAIMTHTYATLVSSVVNGLIAGAILFLVINERRQNRKAREEILEQPVYSSIPSRTPVAVRMQRLNDREADFDQAFTELTSTLEFEFSRGHTTQQFAVI